MADQGMTVGTIALGVSLDYGEFKRQLQELSGQAGKMVKDGFKNVAVDVGKDMAKALDTKPVDTFAKAVRGAQEDLADVSKEIQKQDGVRSRSLLWGRM